MKLDPNPGSSVNNPSLWNGDANDDGDSDDVDLLCRGMLREGGGGDHQGNRILPLVPSIFGSRLLRLRINQFFLAQTNNQGLAFLFLAKQNVGF